MSKKQKIIAVIPSRYGATRLPAKPLADINGKPMIYHVWNGTRKAKNVDEVIVATDDRRIVAAVEEFGGKAVMTSKKCRSGTERVAEVARKTKGDIYINVQGDEPLIKPQAVDKVVEPFREKDVLMSTLMIKLKDKKEFEDPGVVKVVINKNGDALYFSRSLIPRARGKYYMNVYKHLGIYAFRREFLLKIPKMEVTKLEKTEMLEQLRVLYNGYKISVLETPHDSIGVDTPADLAKVRKILKK